MGRECTSRRKEEGGRRKEEGGRRKEEGGNPDSLCRIARVVFEREPFA
jgi:hypothetical protein